jgi:hypothetical protein
MPVRPRQDNAGLPPAVISPRANDGIQRPAGAGHRIPQQTILPHARTIARRRAVRDVTKRE